MQVGGPQPTRALEQGRRDSPFKSNLLVLLVLFPLVFAWAHYVSRRSIDPHGVPACAFILGRT